MTDTEIKKRIKKLEEQKQKISDEIYELQQGNPGFWVGTILSEHHTEYYRLGFMTEAKAMERMKEIASRSNSRWNIKKVTDEYNRKMYEAYSIEEVCTIMGYNSVFKPYEEFYNALEKDLTKRKKELGIPNDCALFE